MVDKLNFKKIDYFSPWIIAICILIFLAIGYIGSFNYRFEYPLNIQTISTVIFGVIVLIIGILIIKYTIKIEDKNKIKISFLSEKLLLILTLIAIILQCINLISIGGIPLFDSVLKSNATTDIWRISYLIFLPSINILLARYYKKKYLFLVLIGSIVYILNGYRTSVIGILGSTFITLYYIEKISRKLGIIFIISIVAGGICIGYIASQSIANQHWMLNPLELIFYRAGFTLEVFQRILNLSGTTHGHILSMIFSSGSPRTFIGNYVLTDNVCITSTLFGPVYLDFGIIGLTIQMLFLGTFLKLLNKMVKVEKGIFIGIYSIILIHTLIWIETGPTDIMIWIFFLFGLILICLNYKNIKKV